MEVSVPRDSSIWSVISADHSWQRIIVVVEILTTERQHHQPLLKIVLALEIIMS